LEARRPQRTSPLLAARGADPSPGVAFTLESLLPLAARMAYRRYDLGKGDYEIG